MRKIRSKQHRILAIAPTARGFGFAVLEDEETLVDWGIKATTGDKNAKSLENVDALIDHYHPEVLVMENHNAKGSRRALRIRKLSEEIIALAAKRRVKVTLFTQKQIKKVFFPKKPGTKYQVATLLTKRFSEELGNRLPPKRKPWMSEDSRMDIFDAVALVLVHRIRKARRTSIKALPPKTQSC